MSRILYKYLTIDGAKWMLGMRKEREYPNLQFTNAIQLNDPFDCHPNLVDFSDMPITDILWSKEKCEKLASRLRKNTWLCCLSKKFNTLLMWSHYCSNHQGICIGLDMKKVKDNLPVIFVGIFGGFLFHMLWEANSRYILTYACMLIPYAASGLEAVTGRRKGLE